MALTLTENKKRAVDAFDARRFPAGRPLWPARFLSNTFEAAWGFVRICRTWNEAQKETQFFPNRAYLRELTRRWLKQRSHGKALIVEKCRRMVVSWLFRALELWAMGCGRCDIMIVGESYISAAKHVWRLQSLYEDLCKRFGADSPEDWRLPSASAIHHQGEKTLAEFTLPNKSVCTAQNGMADKIQGEGISIICLEEMGTYRYLKSILGQASIIVKGEAGKVGGFVCGVTNACTKSEWQDIKAVYVNPKVNLTRTFTGFSEADPGDGSLYVKVEYFADPDKDKQWRDETKQEMQHTPRVYRREILMDDTVVEGDPVWEDYDSRIHEYDGDPIRMLSGDGRLFGLWDCGTARMPAFVLAIWTPRHRQLRFVVECVPTRGMAMETFAPMVKACLKRICPGYLTAIEHYGDETVRTKSGAVEKSAAMVAFEHGFTIHPVSNRWASESGREQSMIHLLNDWCDDAQKFPRLIFSTQGCPVLVKGMRGAYCTEKRKNRDASGPGQEIVAPKKDFFSHVNDAAQVGAVVIMREMKHGSRRKGSDD